eukprot:TRINITY_DN67080_c0_g1_i1.p1 TRINITY_DN67080_c0_g1~~TRINITY_DN67080_c0_g1_i1.p1  ORF type:complete len:384 (-),score=97.45 TRINITY_DN67080_c0_g1_i1:65-1138(-)
MTDHDAPALQQDAASPATASNAAAASVEDASSTSTIPLTRKRGRITVTSADAMPIVSPRNGAGSSSSGGSSSSAVGGGGAALTSSSYHSSKGSGKISKQWTEEENLLVLRSMAKHYARLKDTEISNSVVYQDMLKELQDQKVQGVTAYNLDNKITGLMRWYRNKLETMGRTESEEEVPHNIPAGHEERWKLLHSILNKYASSVAAAAAAAPPSAANGAAAEGLEGGDDSSEVEESADDGDDEVDLPIVQPPPRPAKRQKVASSSDQIDSDTTADRHHLAASTSARDGSANGDAGLSESCMSLMRLLVSELRENRRRAAEVRKDAEDERKYRLERAKILLEARRAGIYSKDLFADSDF